jgi:hypothetical protein
MNEADPEFCKKNNPKKYRKLKIFPIRKYKFNLYWKLIFLLVMGRVFSMVLEPNGDRRPLSWADCPYDEKLAKLMIDVERLGNSREKQHARALEHLCKG